ncbi:NAD-dependent epimerase/dehydratase family protein [Thermodesulfobacteriota bacterium]
MKKNKILITGGAGFIGSFICRQLLEVGCQPVVYDAFIQYVSPFESFYQKYLEYRFKGIKEKVIFERGDTRDKNDLRRVVHKYRPSAIIHLAALPIADMSFTHPEETVGSIINGTVNVLDIVSEVDFVQRFVYASSSMVYGDFIEIPATEDHPKAPKDIYGGTKLAGEILTETYSRRYGIKHTIVRPSAVYGPTDVNRRVSQIFLENAFKGKKLSLHGGGESALDFTYVDDAARGFVLATLSPEGENQVFNITRGEGRTLRNFVDILKEYFSDLEIEMKSLEFYRPKRGALSVEKANKLLGYSPEYALEDGIEKYIQFFKEINNLND